MSPYVSYKLKHRFEFLQVIFAWCLCYLWVVPYAVFIYILVDVLLSLALTASRAGDLDTGLLLLIAGLGLLVIGVLHTPAIHLFVKIIRAHRAAKDISGLEVLPNRLADLLKSRLDYIVSRMQPNDRERVQKAWFRFVIERRNHKATPCIIVGHGTVNLILSLGFFKVLRADPEAADAMLAHELAHFLQRDSSFLLAVRSYLKASKIVLYYMAASFGITVIFSVINWGNLAAQRTQLLEEIRQSNYSLVDYDTSAAAWIRDQRRDQRVRTLKSFESQQSSVLVQLAVLFWSFPHYLLLILYLRRRVRRSEMLADLFAAITTTSAAVERFLQGYIADTDRRSSLHPPVGRRIKYIANFASRHPKLRPLPSI